MLPLQVQTQQQLAVAGLEVQDLEFRHGKQQEKETQLSQAAL